MQRTQKLDEGEYKRILDSFVEVKLTNSENFLKVAETLTRVGIVGKSRVDQNKRVLYQSCHILHKNNPDRYYIVHFKEMFKLDGRESDFSPADMVRRNRIAQMLVDWGLVELIKPFKREDLEYEGEYLHMKVIQFKDKDNWLLEPKYDIGRKGNR